MGEGVSVLVVVIVRRGLMCLFVWGLMQLKACVTTGAID